MGKILMIKGADFSSVAVATDLITEPDAEGYYALNISIEGEQGIVVTTGRVNVQTGGRFSHSNFVGVAGFSMLKYSRPTINTNSNLGMAFYDGNKAFISGGEAGYKQSQSAEVYVESIIPIPANAVYARFTLYNAEYQLGFYAKGKP